MSLLATVKNKKNFKKSAFLTLQRESGGPSSDICYFKERLQGRDRERFTTGSFIYLFIASSHASRIHVSSLCPSVTIVKEILMCFSLMGIYAPV